MARMFLSGQTTCALLLGAGLLLRAQAALQREPEPAQQAVEAPRTRPAEMFADQTLRARAAARALSSPRVVRPAAAEEGAAAPRPVAARTQSRKRVLHRAGRAGHKAHGNRGAALAGGSR